MKVVILYRPNSEHARGVEEFVHGYTVRYPEAKVETLNIDSREGTAMASLYDIIQYPALMVLTVDGSMIKLWQGETIPRLDEVAAYGYTM